MKLKDLKNGYVVETKNGTLLLVVKFGHSTDNNTTDIAMSHNCWVNLNHYKEDFTRLEYLRQGKQKAIEEKRNIVAVYESKRYGVYCTLNEILNRDNLKLIWRLDEPKKMTKQDIEKELGYKFELIEDKE